MVNCPLLQVNALNDIFWRKMKVFDKQKNIVYPIENKRRYLTKEFHCKYIIAFDTETYKGKVKLLADSENRYILNPSFLECLDFLFYKGYQPNGYRFFYNIDFDITAILKTWTNINKIKDLKDGLTVKFHDYSLTWFKGKFFKIRKNKRSIMFTDLFNFFKLGLNKASKKYLKDVEKDKIDGNKLNTSIQYWNTHLHEIIEYCLKDCIITLKLAKLLVNALNIAKISLPRNLVSNGSIAKSDFRTNCRMNNMFNVPKTIIQIAYDCYFGGKFEIQKRGFFKETFLFDINSQYPSFIKEIYDINYGIWKKIDKLPKSQCFGYFKVDLDIPKHIELSTIPLKLKNSTILTVCGVIKNRWFTWYDLDLMRDYISKFHLGYIFLPTKQENEIKQDKLKYVKPFKERILYHYKMKTKYKGNNDMLYNVHKITMNALYGSFIERHESLNQKREKVYSVGILFNPVYASQITAFGRWSIIKDIPKQEWKYIIGIHTDSIICEKDFSKYLTLNKEIGNWTLETKGKTLIINTGIYQIGNIIKSRGIPKKYVNDWFEFCEQNKDLSKKQFEKYRMRKISESLIRDKNILNANTLMIIKKTVDVNADHKRHWNSKFINFYDLSKRKITSKLWYCYIDNYEHYKDLDIASCLFQNSLATLLI